MYGLMDSISLKDVSLYFQFAVVWISAFRHSTDVVYEVKAMNQCLSVVSCEIFTVPIYFPVLLNIS